MLLGALLTREGGAQCWWHPSYARHLQHPLCVCPACVQYNVSDLMRLRPECCLYKQLHDIQQTTLKVRRPHLALSSLAESHTAAAAVAAAGAQQQGSQHGVKSQLQ